MEMKDYSNEIEATKSFVSRKIDYAIEELIKYLDEHGDYVDLELDRRIDKLEMVLPTPTDKLKDLNLLRVRINTSFTELRMDINTSLDILDKETAKELDSIDPESSTLNRDIDEALLQFEQKFFILTDEFENRIVKWADSFIKEMDGILNKVRNRTIVSKDGTKNFHAVGNDGVERNFELLKGGKLDIGNIKQKVPSM